MLLSLGASACVDWLSENRYEPPQAGPASNRRLLSRRCTRSFASKTFASPLCASLRPSMAYDIFGKPIHTRTSG